MEDERFDHILVRHGLSEAAAQRIIRLGRELRRRTRRAGTEFAALVDADAGVPAGAIIQGTASVTDISPHLALVDPRRRYVNLHTHVRGTAPSDTDGAQLALVPPLVAMVVWGANDVRYVLSREPDVPIMSAEEIGAAYHAERLSCIGEYRELVRSMRSERRAAVVMTHRLWERIAGGVGLRYDRFVPAERAL